MAMLNTLSETVSDEQEIKTLYIGNLPLEANETLLVDLFQNLGAVVSCKIIRDGLSDPYCFIEYADQNSAMNARTAMDGRNLLGKNLKVNWASSSGVVTNKVDTSKHFHVFVGDLSPDISTQRLRDSFKQFGNISDCRVVKDLQTLKSKGYGFVSYINKQDAENAMTSMNGQWLGNRVIRTNWATRKPFPLQINNKNSNIYYSNSQNDESNYKSNINQNNLHGYQSSNLNKKSLSYNDVFARTTPSNTTVYCGGIQSGLTEQMIRENFHKFGDIIDVRIFKEKGYAFIKFLKKESACNAIVSVNNTQISGFGVKCSWGKENIDSNHLINNEDGLNNNNYYYNNPVENVDMINLNPTAKMGLLSPFILASPPSMPLPGGTNYQYQQPNLILGLVGSTNQNQNIQQNYQNYAFNNGNNFNNMNNSKFDNLVNNNRNQQQLALHQNLINQVTPHQNLQHQQYINDNTLSNQYQLQYAYNNANTSHSSSLLQSKEISVNKVNYNNGKPVNPSNTNNNLVMAMLSSSQFASLPKTNNHMNMGNNQNNNLMNINEAQMRNNMMQTPTNSLTSPNPNNSNLNYPIVNANTVVASNQMSNYPYGIGYPQYWYNTAMPAQYLSHQDITHQGWSPISAIPQPNNYINPCPTPLSNIMAPVSTFS
ncbi:unnamed protein product [Gordionus sp. m RMFG-2023]|uniref:putative uncharacterized protein DDB_G0286901 isoform X2 n=1 Tax=Gordionus sp. m RMFG-2023 TaxID=3053472 RepID=UPI0030E48C1E